MQFFADAANLIIFVAVVGVVLLSLDVLGRMRDEMPRRRRWYSPLVIVDQLRTRHFYVFLLLAAFLFVLVHLVAPIVKGF